MTTGDIGAIGLLLDIIGAFFLSESFVIKRLEEAVREGSDYMDGNPFRLRSAIQQRIEARIGFAFLALGFACQLLAYSSIFPNGATSSLGYIISSAAVIFVVSLLIVRRASVHASRLTLAKHWTNIKQNLESDSKLATFFAPALDVKFKKGESSKAVAERIIKCLDKYGR